MEKPFILLYKIFVDPALIAAAAAVVVVVVWDVRKMLVDFIFNNEVYEKH